MAKSKAKDKSEPSAAWAMPDGAMQVNMEGARKAQDPASRRPGAAALGSDLRALQEHFAGDVIGSLWIPSNLSADEKAKKINAALLMLARLEPRDEAESMLAVQMIASHSAAMECHRRAMIPDLTFQGRDMALKHAAKMSALYEKQLAAYDKRRGKRNQTVVVKHVTIKDGGQAILGDVHSGGGGDGAATRQPALNHRSDAVMDAGSPSSELEASPRSRSDGPAKP